MNECQLTRRPNKFRILSSICTRSPTHPLSQCTAVQCVGLSVMRDIALVAPRCLWRTARNPRNCTVTVMRTVNSQSINIHSRDQHQLNSLIHGTHSPPHEARQGKRTNEARQSVTVTRKPLTDLRTHAHAGHGRKPQRRKLGNREA